MGDVDDESNTQDYLAAVAQAEQEPSVLERQREIADKLRRDRVEKVARRRQTNGSEASRERSSKAREN